MNANYFCLLFTLCEALGVQPEILHTLDPSLLSFLVVPLVRELRSTRSCDFLNRGGGFIKGLLRGVRCTKSLRVLFLLRRPPSWTTLVLYSREVFIFNEPALSLLSLFHRKCTCVNSNQRRLSNVVFCF